MQGGGCGAGCLSFAEPGNYCAQSRHACEADCGRTNAQFMWCPYADEPPPDLCAADASASFSDLTLEAYA